MKVAAIQFRTGLDETETRTRMEALVREAAATGVSYVQTPEMSNLFLARGSEQRAAARTLEVDGFVGAMRALAAELGITLHLGSVAVLMEGDAQGRLANRSVVIGPSGDILGTYDKIHLFDANPRPDERYRESRAYAPGGRLVTVPVGEACLGLTICYDVRFPALYRRLAQMGADVIAVPAAFSATTGPKHWKTLLRARAIETGAFIVAAAQGGHHENGRATHGHSLIVGPDGAVLAERAGVEPGVLTAEIDLGEVAIARAAVPALANDAMAGLEGRAAP